VIEYRRDEFVSIRDSCTHLRQTAASHSNDTALAVHAVFAAGHKTDAELTEAMVGTWEGLPTEIGVSKAFILLNADGTFRAFELTNNHGSAVRLETEGRWRINNGWVLREIMKEIPPNEKTHSSSHLRDYIESIGGGRVKLADGRKTAKCAGLVACLICRRSSHQRNGFRNYL
jgi:hypothetical protein